MMYSYLAFDNDWKLLIPFRTWQNTITRPAAAELAELFSFNIPQRWRIAHLYQAILNEEDYEKNTGTGIVEIFLERCLEFFAIPGVICASHGLFA